MSEARFAVGDYVRIGCHDGQIHRIREVTHVTTFETLPNGWWYALDGICPREHETSLLEVTALERLAAEIL